MFLKLVIIAVLDATRARALVLDSDVLFFRRPVELLDWYWSEQDEILYNAESDRRKPHHPLRGGVYLPRREATDGTHAIFDDDELVILSDLVGAPVGFAKHFNAGLFAVPPGALQVSTLEALAHGLARMGYGPRSPGYIYMDQALLAIAIASHGHRVLPSEYYCYSQSQPDIVISRHYIGNTKWRIGGYLLPAARAILRRPAHQGLSAYGRRY